jgi:hypothetical protein
LNLDGVVNGDAYAAIQERQLSDYAYNKGLSYLVDWPFNIGTFRRFSVKSASFPGMQVAGRASWQGGDRFVILKLDWSAKRGSDVVGEAPRGIRVGDLAHVPGP